MAEPATTEARLSRRRYDVAHAWLDAAIYRELQAEADRRRVHPDQLAATLLDAVLVNGWTDQVLARAAR